MGGGEEMIENEWESVVNQPIGSGGHTYKAPVLLLGFSPREISSYVLRETIQGFSLTATLLAIAKIGTFLKCHQANS